MVRDGERLCMQRTNAGPALTTKDEGRTKQVLQSNGVCTMSPVSNPSKPAGMKLTYDDFVLFPDDGKRSSVSCMSAPV